MKNILLTTFIHPIEKSLLLSNKLDIYLDNVRTAEEKKYLKEKIHKSFIQYDKLKEKTSDTHKDFDLGNTIHLTNKYKEYLSKCDSYACQFVKKYSKADYLNFLTNSWIILRYNEDVIDIFFSKRELKKAKEDKHFKQLFRIEDKILDYCYLLTLIILFKRGSSNEFSTFLLRGPWLNSKYYKEDLELSGHLFAHVITWSSIKHLFAPYSTFYEIRDKLIRYANLIEEKIDPLYDSFLLYIGNIIKLAAKDIHDAKLNLVLLVSVIESFLTHSPDFNRFNVEDSINKQFQLKTAIAVNKINPSMELKEMQKKLKLIYNVRSNIAHGNFTSLNKQFESNSKMESLDFFLDSLSFELLLYITDIIKLYLNDEEYINFLKNS